MSGMFSGATAFDRNISKWNTESLQNASFMFNGATSLIQIYQLVFYRKCN